MAISWKPVTDSGDCIEMFHTVVELCSSWSALCPRRRVAVDISTGKKSIVSAVGRAATACGTDLLYFPNTELERSTETSKALERLECENIDRAFFGEIQVNGSDKSTARDIWNMTIQSKIGIRLFQQAQWNSCAYHLKRVEAYQKASIYSSGKKRKLSNNLGHTSEVYTRVASIYKHWNNLGFKRAMTYVESATQAVRYSEAPKTSKIYLQQRLTGSTPLVSLHLIVVLPCITALDCSVALHHCT